EDLLAVRIRTEWIAARREHECPGHRVLARRLDGATRWRTCVASQSRVFSFTKVGELPQVGAQPVDGKDLAVLGRIAAAHLRWVGGCDQEHALAIEVHR